MSRFLSWLGSLAAELQRRRVYHVASVYAVVGWVVLQVAKILVDALFLPPASLTAILVLVLLGFPLTMVVTWLYDLTPEGMERTSASGADAPPPGVRRGVLAVLMAATLLATAGAGWASWRVWLGPSAAAGSDVEGADAGLELDPNRLAVLYFDNLSGDPGLDAVAGGLTEDLTHELAQVESLDVVPRNAVKPYRSGEVPLDSIARSLGTGTLVEGSVRMDGDRLEVTAQLVDASRGSHITSERVRRAGGNLLRLRREIVEEVALAIRQHLGREIELREIRSRTDDAAAWRLYHEARELAGAADSARLERDTAAAQLLYVRADSLLDRSMELDRGWLDPVLERGWVFEGLARLPGLSSQAMDPGALRTGLGYAEHAMGVAPGSPAALELRGTLRFDLSAVVPPDSAARLRGAAEQDLENAVAADPGRARAWTVLAFLRLQQGRKAEAQIAARHAWEADPYLVHDFNPFVVARVALEDKRFDVVLEATRRMRQRTPHEPAYPALQLTALAGHDAPLAPPDTAWTLLGEVAGDEPARRWPSGLLLVAAVLARTDLPDSARAVLERGRAAAPDRPLTHYYGANVHLLLGEESRALEQLERYLTAQPNDRAYVASDWWWEPLREVPGFVALVGSAD